MAWKQILSPNLDNDPNKPLYVWANGGILSDWYGWCLAVVAASYGAQGSSYSAKTAWEANPTKHRNWDIPEKVWTPLWYEGGTYGHVVIGYREGNYITVYSSPYTHKPTFEVFGGDLHGILEYIGNIYGVGGFSGWSETVLDSRVIEQYTETKPTPKPEPTPEPEPSEPIEDNQGKDEDMATPTPVQPIDQQLAGGFMEEAGESLDQWFSFPPVVRLIAYLVGDALLVGAILVPDIINTIQNADNLTIFGEYLAKVLLEAGTCILMVFKLIKKK